MKRVFLFSALVSFVMTGALPAEDWSFLNVRRTGAEQFIRQNPGYNGKGVVIIVLDTGIDMDVPGLKHTPEGDVKVIDAQDFSGEGDIYYETAEKGEEKNEKFLKHSSSYKLYGYDKLALRPPDDTWYIGVLREDHFMNSSVADVNNNGKLDEDFGFAVMNDGKDWVCYVDLDADGNIDDEEPLWNYREKFQSFRLRGRNEDISRNMVNFALNIYPDENRVNFHYDGSGHGTHVAGIAAGFSINGQEGLNGVAPGAKLISLKIGDTQLSGGATRTGSMLRAYEYGMDYAKTHNGPVVFNMSFGIGSEEEGRSEMDYMIDDFLEENENVVICLSAGNEGPGISTVGLPAAASRALTVGALQTKETARDVYDADPAEDKVFYFSSRGGELAKPDILAPGAASATVPPFSTRENKWGTSMASPQAAGAVALVMSAAWQENPALPINGAILKKAIRNAADYLPGYAPIDQGSGVFNVPRTFEFYTFYIQNEEHKKVLDYNISTVSPAFRSEEGPAAYWRFGTSFPDALDRQKFYINAILPGEKKADEKYEFYRAFNLESSHPWIKLNKKSTYVKGQESATVDLYFDKGKMTIPGLYSGKVSAFRKGGLFSGNNPRNKEFDLFCSVVVPVTFDSDNQHTWQSPVYKIQPGDVQRIFFEIPLRASSCTIQLMQEDKQYANIRGYLFDPEGREQKTLTVDTEKEDETLIYLTSKDLEPGIWELDLWANYKNDRTSGIRAEICFSGLEILPETITRVRIKNGSNPEGRFSVTNHYSEKLEAKLSGRVFGYRRVQHLDEYSDSFEYTFTVGDDIDKVEFELEMSTEVFNMFTDFAMNIRDMEGNTLKKDALTYKKGSLTFLVPSSDTYILELVPAFAGKEVKNWTARLQESYYKFKQQNITGTSFVFYPKVRKDVDFEIDGTLSVAPDDFFVFGEIWIYSSGKKNYRVSVPIELYTGLN